ncbi:single-stranded DNA-binding protein [Candidatus Gottesmanbacteria bacterium]|nr:single-stranded DNA-binding protein [Candidatus Gottesmanbacteria bacterium]
MARSLNKVQLIGNLTRDPELRYTPSGAAVCTIGLATNRYWTTESGEKKEEVEFHRVVAWNKLAELCSQLLTKGRKVYVEGRLRTAAWQTADGSQRTTTEIVIEDMILLDSRLPAGQAGRPVGAGESGGVETGTNGAPTQAPAGAVPVQTSSTKRTVAQPSVKKATDDQTAPATQVDGKEDVNPDDIPF